MSNYEYDYRKVRAIDPFSGRVVDAILKPTHFNGMPAISFYGVNMPNYSADDIAWEDIEDSE